ncbi:MAG TPA: gephyrin-like molybdotransferase Glp [Vicinamibacterales bacterium]|jgi:molybdenum cofactor synthesis domain-containing protein|nr:molybdopterin-binding protein [Vicinamibacterales bacterium]HJN46269.1 gephyrin-like molybdotransferase Glp [Vicinamibacterales bacterium]|tara:strand:+ start:243 stop:1466 length:1224 start_codon:yes stop_codon:yes gene_type:complete
MTGTKMRPITKTIPLEEALTLATAAAVPLDRTERIDLDESVGRVLATAVVADQDVPPFNRAAMDGYAVVADTTFGASRTNPRCLECVETVHTGGLPSKTLEPGQCTQIATGAPMPAGADAVVMVEETDRRDGDEVAIFTQVHPRQHVGRRGADITDGTELLRPGDLLTPSRVGSIAALGIAEIDVYVRPSVALISTGNEIIAPGQPLGPGQIYDINRFTLGSVVREHGGVPVPFPTTGDNLDELSAAVDACLEHDILVFSGGSSVGERDLTLDVMQRKGEILFHGIAVKPGRPTAFGTIGSIPVLGMPGYPTSCLSNAYILLVPVLRRLARLPVYRFRTVSVPASQRFVSTTDRHQFYTVRVVDGLAVPAFKASGDITSMSQADGYIEIPAQTDVVEEGETVEVKLF